MSEIAKRVAFAAVAIPVVGAMVYAGGIGLSALLAAAAVVVAWEYFQLARAAGTSPLVGHGLVLSAAVPLAVHARLVGAWVPGVGLLMLVVLELLAVAVWARGATMRPLESVAVTLFGPLYSGGMLAFALALRYHPYAIDALGGALLVGLPLLVTWGTDTAAMLAGRRWGTTKLIPSVSPGKTVVGAWAGALAGALIAVAYLVFLLRPYAHLSMSVAAAAAFGLVVSAAGQVGDLAESLLKRQAGVKDSSALIPGHGGALDRVDSLLFALPVSFILLDLLLTVG